MYVPHQVKTCYKLYIYNIKNIQVKTCFLQNRFGLDRFCLVLFGFVWVWFGFGLVLFGFVWLGLVLFGFVWFCLVLFGLVWFGFVWFCLVKVEIVCIHTRKKSAGK